MSSADGSTTLWVKEDHQSLMGLNAAREIVREDADELGAEDSTLAHRAGHDAEHAAVRQGNDRAQQLLGFAAREGDHGLAHDRDTPLVRQPPGDFFSVNESHVTGSLNHQLPAKRMLPLF